jgi:lipid-binding SYLF domain-containing protein
VLKSDGSGSSNVGHPSFAAMSSNDDASMTYVGTSNSLLNNNQDDAAIDHTILYGRGLEQRMLLARHPQRTCHSCRSRLEPLQEELCLRNSNAMRYNYIDEGNHLRAHCNSPLAFTLGHEVRKAAYTLSNLLPGNNVRSTRSSAFIPTNTDNEYTSYPPADSDPCHIPSGASCKSIDPTLRKLDGLRIPAKVLERAKGVAVVTSAKAGIGFAGFEFGTGLVVARRSSPDGVVALDAWTAPSAICIASVAMGALVGAQVSDHVFLLMNDDAVRLFASDNGRSIQLGADVGVAVGPLGRSAEADLGATGSSRNLEGFGGGVAMSPIYSYSLSKGLYAGVSMDGRMLMTRDRVNEKFYGRAVSAHEILSGKVATPPAAQPLYDALKRCRVYGESGSRSSNAAGRITTGIMEGFSHTTGAGMPVSSHPSPKNGNMNPYNLSGRDDHFGY